MNWSALFTTVFDVVYLSVLLYVIWRFMRSSERNAKSNQDIARILIDVTASNAQSAKIAAQAAQDVVNLLKEQHHEH